MRVFRSVVSAVLGGVALCCLAACEPNPPISDGPISLSVTGQVLSIAICRDVDIIEISAAVREPGTEWVEFFNGTGELTVTRGDSYDLEALASMLTVTVNDDPMVSERTEVDVFIQGRKSSQNLYTSLKIGEDGQDGKWLRGDGTVGVEPCTS